MNRRQFSFWVGFGLFSLSNRLRVYALDDLAAATMRATETSSQGDTASAAVEEVPVHWTKIEKNGLRWFEREDYVDGKWKLVGTTTPINRATGKPTDDGKEHLADDTVPAEMRKGKKKELLDLPAEMEAEYERHQPNPKFRARHGRPPSKWLRSLEADELRIWLRTIDPPEAGVEGMSYWEHLTRDHSFDPKKIKGLTEAEQAKLHAAAHHGY
jgi:hypothetical protein